jgi:hypothetical protein
MLTELKVEQWGPLLWKYLHISAERIGCSSNPILEADSANSIQLLITGLPDIIPCPDCQLHARTYLSTNKFSAKDLKGCELQTYVRNYLFTFHAAIRARKGQPVIVESAEACAALYGPMLITAEDDKNMADYFRHALLYRIINSTKYMRWWDAFRRLRLSLGY